MINFHHAPDGSDSVYKGMIMPFSVLVKGLQGAGLPMCGSRRLKHQWLFPLALLPTPPHAQQDRAPTSCLLRYYLFSILMFRRMLIALTRWFVDCPRPCGRGDLIRPFFANGVIPVFTYTRYYAIASLSRLRARAQ